MRIGIEGGRWTVDGEVTYPGAPAEGLLMNVRMVNAVFEDAGRPSLIDPEANTARFLARIPEYVGWGVRAFTLCLQGGYPGYEGAVNTAFHEDGSLEPRYMARVQRVIGACDRAGAAVILGLYYQRQDQYLRDEGAVEAGVVHAVEWLRALGARNVVLEIANEYNARGFDHACLREPEGVARLIRLAKATDPGLLVSASGVGDGRVDDAVGEAADYILFHLNSTPHAEIPARIAELKRFHKPLVCNEDRKLDAEGARAAALCVEHGAGWGLMAREVNQYFPPFRFGGAGDDLVVYRAIRALTTPPEDERALAGYEEGRRVTLRGGSGRRDDAAEYFPPPDGEGGWRTLLGEREIRRVAGMEVRGLDEAFRYLQTCLPNGGLLVARRGWLVYERYLGLASRDATPNMASCGKSFTSIAMGILMGEMPECFPEGLEQRVWTPEYLPEVAFPLTDPAKAEITLGQLLAFSAGIRGNNPSYIHGQPVTLDPKGTDGWQAMVDEVAAGQRDMVDPSGYLVSTRSLWCPPGGGYSYASSSIHLVSMILRHLAGCELEEYVRRRIAGPLGWGPFGWGYRQHPAVTHTPGAGGIALRATDVLRFCYLLLRGGRWGDAQVVPEEYVRHCSGPSPFQPHYPYSLQFNVNGTGQWPEAPRDTFWKSGSGGYCLYVVPSLDLVVYKMGGRNGQYSPADTGMPLPPSTGEPGTPDTPELSEYRNLALRKVLEMVVRAVRD
jgi:CubicO group peptidase (beta-lactamase class C family)